MAVSLRFSALLQIFIDPITVQLVGDDMDGVVTVLFKFGDSRIMILQNADTDRCRYHQSSGDRDNKRDFPAQGKPLAVMRIVPLYQGDIIPASCLDIVKNA